MITEIKMFKIGKVFYFAHCKWCFWFRFFNAYGFHGKNVKIWGLMFSERVGYIKRLKIGNWSFKILKP